jgi:hypothetical protein
MLLGLRGVQDFGSWGANVSNLYVYDMPIDDLAAFAGSDRLDFLSLYGLPIKRLSLGNAGPSRLWIGLTHLESLGDAATMTRVKDLTLWKTATALDHTRVGEFPNLTGLTLHSLDHLSNMRFLARAKGLKRLDLNFCMQLSDLSDLDQCQQLTKVSIMGCPNVRDLSFFERLPNARVEIRWPSESIRIPRSVARRVTIR